MIASCTGDDSHDDNGNDGRESNNVRGGDPMALARDV